VRHDAGLATKEKDGSTRRAHLEAAARRGHPAAVAALEGPECPDAVSYLRDWLHELHGRSGVGMSGLAPLTYGAIADWARLTGRRPHPYEVRALLTLDAVMLFPDAGAEE
jgi:hypothetical protein